MNERTVWVDGERVRQFRRRQGLSQKELAVRAGVAKRTLENIENNRHAVLLHTIRAVADALELSLSAVLISGMPIASTPDDLSAPALTLDVTAEVQCSQCQMPNRPARQFCATCGYELWRPCLSCGFSNSALEHFCGGCGRDITIDLPFEVQGRAGDPLTSVSSRLTSVVPAGLGSRQSERKQVTVLVAALVGCQGLMQLENPEAEDEVLSRCFTLLVASMHRADGLVTQVTGDSLTAIFGVPVAYEDHVLRALHAALELQRAFAPFAEYLQRTYDLRLALRLGAHTGPVVVGVVQPDAQLHTFTPTNTFRLAVDLQACAHEGAIAVSEVVQQQAQGFFRFTDHGMQVLPGRTQPLRVYICKGVRTSVSRLEVSLIRGRSVFRGRDKEMALLRARWRRVSRAEGQVVCLVGEAGVGKSRLASEFLQGLAGVQWLTVQAFSYQQATPYGAVIPLLRRLLDVADDETPAQQRQQIRAALAAIDPALAAHAPLLAHLFAIPLETEALPDLNPKAQRQRLQHACLQVMLQQALDTPLCLLVEDGQWLDQSSRELLDLLVVALARHRILLLCTARPGFRPDWSDRSHFRQIAVRTLPIKPMNALIRDFLQPYEASRPLRIFIHQHTAGNPLFVEELLQTMHAEGLLVLRGGRYELQGDAPGTLPVSIQGIVQARLDRLPAEAKRLIQVAAVIGTNVPLELMQALEVLPEEALQRSLIDLLAAEFLQEVRDVSAPAYTFKHILLQESVYNALVQRTRQQWHRRVAEVIEAQFPHLGQAAPEVLARHYTVAGLERQAVEHWQRAGQHALQRSAYAEAVSHLTRGLEVLTTMPETPERLQDELTLQTALGPALMAVKGQSAPEVAQTYARARELCRQIGETPQLFPVLLGLWRFYGARADLKTAREIAVLMLQIASEAGDPALLLEAHMAMGNSLFFDAEFAAAQRHLEQGMTLYETQQHQDYSVFNIRNPGVVCRSITALALGKLGYLDQALRLSQDAMTLAQQLSHPFTLAFACYQAGLVHQFRGEAALAFERAEAARTLAAEHELDPWMWGQATTLLGWTLALQGQGEAGIAELEQGISTLESIEAKMPWPLCQLVDAYRSMGQAKAGLRALSEAESHGPVDTPTVSWLRGELLLLQEAPDAEQAEQCWHDALTMFRHQEARPDELRVVLSLSRLWHAQGKRAAARRLLAECYDGFTEGHDTPLLTEAGRFLKTLS